jgi:lysophospholipase L1-like esterase
MHKNHRRAIAVLATLILSLSINSQAAEKSKLVSNLEAGKKQTVVTYGTSLTAGGAWVGQLSAELKRLYTGLPTVINSGGSGMCSKWGVDNLNTRVLAKQPDAVFIEFSINDAFLKYKVSVPQARSNLLNMVDRLLATNKTCEIILMVMNPPIGNHLTARPDIESYNQMYRDVAAERRLMLIDHYPDWQKILNADPKQFTALVPDGIHPNAEGCKQIILPNILRALGVKTETTPTPAAPAAGVK